MPHAGYNIYVCGLGGTHREQTVAKLLSDLTRNLPRPGDRVLVQNFQNRDRPRTFYLPAGQGKQLRRDLQELVEELRRLLPETFRKETFEEEKEQLAERYGHEGEEIAQSCSSVRREGLRPAAAPAGRRRLHSAQGWQADGAGSVREAQRGRSRPACATASASCRAR